MRYTGKVCVRKYSSSNYGADHGNGFSIGGVVGGMQIPSCFVVSARLKRAKKWIVDESAK
jgi:hypothetical protein